MGADFTMMMADRNATTRGALARRWLVHAAACAVIGAAMTVLVAFACAFIDVSTNAPTMWSSIGGKDDRWAYWIEHRPGVVQVYRLPNLADRVVGPHPPSAAAPKWSAVHEPVPPESTPSTLIALEDARGWPLAALRSESRVRWGKLHREIVDGWLIDQPPNRNDDPRVLPLRPIWSGFAIDTFVYGLLAFGVVFLPGVTRRVLRRRRGACVWCGYDLRGGRAVSGGPGACPECGATGGEPPR